MSNNQLLSAFKDAVSDDNYTYNDSGFSYDKLESEILRRMYEDGDGEWRMMTDERGTNEWIMHQWCMTN